MCKGRFAVLFLVLWLFSLVSFASLYQKIDVDQFVTLIQSTDGRSTGYSWSLSYDPVNNNSREVYFSFDVSAVTDSLSYTSLTVSVAQDLAMSPAELDNFWVGLHEVSAVNAWDTDFTWSTKPAYEETPLAYINVQSTERKNLVFSSPALTARLNEAITQNDSLVTFALRGRDPLPDYRLFGRHIESGSSRTKLEMSLIASPKQEASSQYINVIEELDSASADNTWELVLDETNNRSKEVLLSFDISQFKQNPSRVALFLDAALLPSYENMQVELALYVPEPVTWNESTTWASRPGADSLLATLIVNELDEPKSYQFASQSFTSYVKAAIDQGHDTVSLLLKSFAKSPQDIVTGHADQFSLSLHFTPPKLDQQVMAGLTVIEEGDTNLLGDQWFVINNTNKQLSKQMIMKFDIADMKAQVQDAALEIYVKQGDTANVDTLNNYELQLFPLNASGWQVKDFTWSDLVPPTRLLASVNVQNVNYQLLTFRGKDLIAYLNEALANELDSLAFLVRSPNQTPGIQVAGLHSKSRLQVSFASSYINQEVFSQLTVFEENDSSSSLQDWLLVQDQSSGHDRNVYCSFYLEQTNTLADTVSVQMLARQDTLPGGLLDASCWLDLYLLDEPYPSDMTWSNQPVLNSSPVASAQITDDNGFRHIRFVSDSLTMRYNQALLNEESMLSFALRLRNDHPGIVVLGDHAFTFLDIDNTPHTVHQIPQRNLMLNEATNTSMSSENWEASAGSNEVLELIRFDISHITHDVTGASLMLTARHESTDQLPLALYVTDNNWDTSTVWTTQPQFDTSALSVIKMEQSPDYENVRFAGHALRNAVNEALSAGKKQVSFAIRSQDLQGGGTFLGSHADSGTLLRLSFDDKVQLEQPDVSPVSGTFSDDTLVTLTTNDANAFIVYTLDGSVPDLNSSVYTEPIFIENKEQVVTLRIKVFQYGKQASDLLEHTYNMIVPTTGYGIGPGGVGFPDISVEGQPQLGLWLKADAIEGLTDGATVHLWEDLSGNENHATSEYAGKRPEGYYAEIKPPPTYHTDCMNGFPCLNMGTSQTDKKALLVPDAPSLDGGPGLGIFLVFERNVLTDPEMPGGDWQRVFEKRQYYTPAYPDYSWVIEIAGQVDANHIKSTINGVNVLDSDRKLLETNSPYLIANNYDQLVNYLYINGSLDVFNNYSQDVMRGTANVVIGNAAKVNLAEVVYFNEGLNYAQFTVVQNALAAKYGLALPEGNLYESPDSYLKGIIGIGKRQYFDEPGREIHEQLYSSGDFFLLSEANASLENGEFVFAGHNGKNIWSDDNWNRVWYLDVTGTVDAKIGFDLNAAGIDNQVDNEVKLWYRETQDADWTALTASPVFDQGKVFFTSTAIESGFYGLGKAEPIGIEQLSEEKTWLAWYPNPASDQLFVESVNQKVYGTTMTAILFSLKGTELLRSHTDESRISLDVSHLPAGVYVLCVHQGDKVSYEKVMIQ